MVSLEENTRKCLSKSESMDLFYTCEHESMTRESRSPNRNKNASQTGQKEGKHDTYQRHHSFDQQLIGTKGRFGFIEWGSQIDMHIAHPEAKHNKPSSKHYKKQHRNQINYDKI